MVALLEHSGTRRNARTDLDITEPWAWFRSVAAESSGNLDDGEILSELDRRVCKLGLAWEVGPGKDAR
jgi:hypothetical protein